MKFQTHCAVAKGPIDPAPMVDIVFLLLIFLVLSSPLVLQPGIGVVLPEANVQPAASFQELVVAISPSDTLFFNNQPVTYESLKRELEAAARQSRNRELIIKADRHVSHGTVTKVMSLAFEAGITAVNLATRPELSAPPPGP
jgi:biopolymer transport protein ExbD